ncbi:hypothetical protein A5784_32825 [Mycobacterium sp. 852013-50091_SCH5140682]|uniref:hypothetical protein n=1 Tax=Mycobacterium sp. 852013-50091_SCH5140682 TaxID=1834109 RepID=UPI0007EA6C7E|nr:hypothetical protein [Mycobacterium sp. 852013-50091_SCH5140682]OBC12614.1 hypothetical protein A5784_32825 [Mycobacterium sp. 852013-50091_SCH5140682]
MSTETTDTTTTTETAGIEPSATETAETAVADTVTPETVLEDGSDVDEDQDDDAGDGKGGREAAKYRRRLREAEAERDQLAERVTALQRAEVERLATADGLKPAALWSSTELAGLLDDEGVVDAAKVAAAISGARDTLGILKPTHNRREGLTVGRPVAKPTGREAMVGVVMGRGVADDV